MWEEDVANTAEKPHTEFYHMRVHVTRLCDANILRKRLHVVEDEVADRHHFADRLRVIPNYNIQEGGNRWVLVLQGLPNLLQGLKQGRELAIKVLGGKET